MGILDDRLALVTGGSRGLGRAMCLALASEGADVAFNYLSNDTAAAETVSSIRALGRRAWSFQVSVTDADGISSMVDQICEEAGRPIDILVNNAGLTQIVPVAMMEESDWDRMLDTHVKGAFLCSRAVLRGMIGQRYGRILNIGSLAGTKMVRAPVHYCTAKAALKGFSESLAKEMGRYGITVNYVAPGALDDGLAVNIPDANLREYEHHCALGRVGGVAEVARVVAFMCSEANSYMNGATVVVDGAV